MKVSAAAAIYEKCMKHLESSECEKCPLYGIMTLKIGDRPGDETGAITWKIQGCSLMDFFEKWLQNKKVKE